MVAYLQKSKGSKGFHQIIDFLNASHIQYTLTENPTIYVSFIKQFWRTTTARTSANREVELTATIDGQVKTINEASLRTHLKLEDNGGITTLPNSEILEQLALMGPKKTAWEQFISNIATAIICLATNKTYNFSKLIFDAMVKNLENPHKCFMYPIFIQIYLNKQRRLLQPHTRTYPTPILTHKVFSNMKRVSKGYSGIDFSLFPTIINAPETSLSRITSSPSLSPQHTPVSTSSTSQPPNTQPTLDAEEPAKQGFRHCCSSSYIILRVAFGHYRDAFSVILGLFIHSRRSIRHEVQGDTLVVIFRGHMLKDLVALHFGETTMITVNQGMSVEEIERVVAQRVANAIEAIAIYETKTNMARKSVSQTKQQENKVAENASNKRRWEGNHNGSSSQQNKGHKVPRAHTTRPINKKAYAGSLPLCNQCKFHHNGPCTCGSRRHYKSECPIVKFQNRVDMIHGRVMASKPKTRPDATEFATKLMDKKISTLAEYQDENKMKLDNTSKNNQNQQQPNKRQNTGRAYTAGHGEKKHYGRSKSLCSKCNYHHDGPCAPKCHKCNRVSHLARDCRSSTNANIANNQRGTGAKLSSFDIIIGMDWLANYHAVIVCDKKIVRVPFENETLIIRGDGSNLGNEIRLNIISCTKTQKYLLKGCPIFLAHVTTKDTEDKSEKKRLEDVPI
ncbi:reverse transcriptase domain-containing protein [Tanacetum coccineum]